MSKDPKRVSLMYKPGTKEWEAQYNMLLDDGVTCEECIHVRTAVPAAAFSAVLKPTRNASFIRVALLQKSLKTNERKIK